jgi:mycofactocin precursor
MTGPETTTPMSQQQTEDVEQEALVEDALVEEISIDGMCGVY